MKITSVKYFFSFMLLMGLTLGVNASYFTFDIYPEEARRITVEGPRAGFNYIPMQQCGNIPVVFNNTSTGEGLTYLWSFGDGATSTEKNPEHMFSSAIGNGDEIFSVTLLVKDNENRTASHTQDVQVKKVPSTDITTNSNNIVFSEKTFSVFCDLNDNEFVFINNSTSRASNLFYIIDWGDGSSLFEAEDWSEVSHTFGVGITTFTYTVVGEHCTVTEEFNVFVGSNPAVGLGNPGSTNVCAGESLTFPIHGTERNAPGTTYTITFSDGSAPIHFVHPPPASITHIFEESSCRSTALETRNSYSVQIEARNPCASSFAIVTPIYVSKVPEPIIEVTQLPVCVDEIVPMTNDTAFGSEVGPGGQCSNSGKFVWEITPAVGWELTAGSLGTMTSSHHTWVSGTPDIYPKFTEPGVYTIKLTNGGRCGTEEIIETVCVIPRPEPEFTLDSEEGCGPIEVRATNTSNIIEACRDLFTWTVDYETGICGTEPDWEFREGTDEFSINPVFAFRTPGLYNINLTYLASCGEFTETKQVNVTAPPIVHLEGLVDLCGPGYLSPTANVLSCNSAEAVYRWTFVGGTPAYSNERIPGDIYFATPGEKQIHLEVTNGCGSDAVSQVFVVKALPEVDLGTSVEICQGESHFIQPAISPAGGNYEYLWTSIPTSAIINATEKNVTVRPTETTTYKLKVTDLDANCFVEEELTIEVIPAPVVRFDLPDQIVCSGETSLPVALSSEAAGAEITWTVEANGVTGTHPFGTVSIPEQVLINSTDQPIEVIYTAIITVSDQGRCDVIPAIYKITVVPILALEDQELEICDGEEAEFAVPDVTYKWEILDQGGVEGASTNLDDFLEFSQRLYNHTLEALTVVYRLTPQYFGCEGEAFMVRVKVLPSPDILFSVPDQTICSGDSSQEIILTSGLANVNFIWEVQVNGVEGLEPAGEGNIPAFDLVNPTEDPIDVIFTVIAEGTNCRSIPEYYTIMVYPALVLDVQVKDYNGFGISCNGAGDGNIKVEMTGGSGNYELQWRGPNGFRSTDREISELEPGVYELAVEDGVACSVVRTFEIIEPLPLSIDLVNKTDVVCKGMDTGAITIAVQGGVRVQGYTYSWIKDGELLDLGGPSVTGLPAGIYEVIVYDVNECSISQIIEIVEPEEALVLSVTKEDVSCFEANDGTIAIAITGGVGPYTVEWDFGSTLMNFDNLAPGTYTVTVKDGIGCTIVRPIIIEDSPYFTIDPEVKQMDCFGSNNASIKLNMTRGQGRVTVRWDHGAQVEDLYNLVAGEYGVTIASGNGCEVRREFTILQPSELVLESTVIDALDCDDPQGGSISINVSGGKPPYTFNWSNGQKLQHLSGIGAGFYMLEVTDAAGCQVKKVYEVKRPAPLTINFIRETNIQCEPRDIEEEISLLISGGVMPYQISWSGGLLSQGGNVMKTDQAGLYIVTVTDGFGCRKQESFKVDNSKVLISAEIEAPDFELYKSYMVNMPIRFNSLSLGPIISFYWDFGDGNSSNAEHATHSYKAAGEYEVVLQITDIYGCTQEIRKVISVLDYFLVVPNIFTPNGDGVNDYFFPKFLNIKSVEFWILNKWGENIFYTDKLDGPGWDGTVNDEEATPGNYVYRLKYQTYDGRTLVKTDIFMLLK